MNNRFFLFFMWIVLGLCITLISVPQSFAQGSAESEFTLEEITVTAEKRKVNVQDIPASVEAISGVDLREQGKISTAQILEDVPNINLVESFRNVGVMVSTPDAGISIRGVQFKQTSDGQPPASTATYVDGVFQGYGSTLDIERVEVLRGPQGTLYGRSATGGVVNFITRNPRLGEFEGSQSFEVGTGSLLNYQFAVNVPIGEKFAIRTAARYFEWDGYHNPDGGWYATREGRIKALFQPTEAFDVMLSATINERKSNSGGYSARLTSPDTIDYEDTWADVVEGVWRTGTQYSLTANYDFGVAVLTYIGSLRHYEDTDSPPEVVTNVGRQIMHNQFFNYGENFKTHELRLTSDWDAWWNWLFGVFYYNSDYDRYQASVNHKAWYTDDAGNTYEDPDPAAVDAPIFGQPAVGDIKNIGIFTEETFNFQEDMHLTLGLRYDKTENHAYSAFNMNLNENEWRNSLNPPEWMFFPYEDTLEWTNVTYKVRFEYDLTEDNILYFLTATGFQPGDIRITNTMGPEGIYMFELPYDEEKLTSYEVGSKNRFLDDRLQLNLSVFYYDYEGFRHTVNTAASGPPVYTIITTPLRMIGAELSSEWLLTERDRLSFSMGVLDAKITGYPDIPEFNPTQQYLMLEELPGMAPFTANLSYDHVFALGNGSTLVPRAELSYTDGMYIENLLSSQIDLGLKPYSYQDSYTIADIGATWTSPNDMYSATAYVRNVFDTEYKTEVNFGGGVEAVGVTPGDPRVWGLVFSISF